MATSTVSEHHETVEKNSTELLDRISMNSCPPSSFPDKFQDFFAALNEDSDDLPSMLEDKLIPRWIFSSWTVMWLSLRKMQMQIFMQNLYFRREKESKNLFMQNRMFRLICWIKMTALFCIIFHLNFRSSIRKLIVVGDFNLIFSSFLIEFN